MANEKITVEESGHVLMIGLNRTEKLNAFDVDMYRELAKAYGELEKNPGADGVGLPVIGIDNGAVGVIVAGAGRNHVIDRRRNVIPRDKFDLLGFVVTDRHRAFDLVQLVFEDFSLSDLSP